MTVNFPIVRRKIPSGRKINKYSTNTLLHVHLWISWAPFDCFRKLQKNLGSSLRTHFLEQEWCLSERLYTLSRFDSFLSLHFIEIFRCFEVLNLLISGTELNRLRKP